MGEVIRGPTLPHVGSEPTDPQECDKDHFTGFLAGKAGLEAIGEH